MQSTAALENKQLTIEGQRVNLCPNCLEPGFSIAQVKVGHEIRHFSEPVMKTFNCEECGYQDERQM